MNLLKVRYFLFLLLCTTLVSAQATLAPEIRAKVDAAVLQILTSTGVPSASVAVVQKGEITYLHAYGQARLDPPTPARPEMRYSIGWISKQFTAAASQVLAGERKLSLDDHVSRSVPNLAWAKDVRIRQLIERTY